MPQQTGQTSMCEQLSVQLLQLPLMLLGWNPNQIAAQHRGSLFVAAAAACNPPLCLEAPQAAAAWVLPGSSGAHEGCFCCSGLRRVQWTGHRCYCPGLSTPNVQSFVRTFLKGLLLRSCRQQLLPLQSLAAGSRRDAQLHY